MSANYLLKLGKHSDSSKPQRTSYTSATNQILIRCRNFIKALSNGPVPRSYSIYNAGGLWMSCITVTLLLEAQAQFNRLVVSPTAPVKKINIKSIIQKIDIGWVTSKEPRIKLSVTSAVTKKILTMYLTAISFGYVKQILASKLQIRGLRRGKSWRKNLKLSTKFN